MRSKLPSMVCRITHTTAMIAMISPVTNQNHVDNPNFAIVISESLSKIKYSANQEPLSSPRLLAVGLVLVEEEQSDGEGHEEDVLPVEDGDGGHRHNRFSIIIFHVSITSGSAIETAECAPAHPRES